MELKEYRKMYEELKEHKSIIANIDTEFFFKFADTVLQALDNSIPKEKVEDKIELYKRLELGSFNRDSIQANEYKAIIKVLQELLEE
jgi:hypothetical protein